jgi:hypothetical protein
VLELWTDLINWLWLIWFEFDGFRIKFLGGLSWFLNVPQTDRSQSWNRYPQWLWMPGVYFFKLFVWMWSESV